MSYRERPTKTVCIEPNVHGSQFWFAALQFLLRFRRPIHAAVLVLMFTPSGSYAQVDPPALVPFTERSRIWNETMEEQRLIKRKADEKVLHELLTKVKDFVEADKFSVIAVERAFDLKLEVVQVLASPDPKIYGVRTLYAAGQVDFPLSSSCPQKNRNLNPKFEPTYWYRSTAYLGTDDNNTALVLFYPLSAWAEASPWDVAKSVFDSPEWSVRYVGSQHAEPSPIWSKKTKRYSYEFSFHQASDNCGAMTLSRALNR